MASNIHSRQRLMGTALMAGSWGTTLKMELPYLRLLTVTTAHTNARAHTHTRRHTRNGRHKPIKAPDLLSRRAKSIPQRAGYWHYISRPANADQTKHVTGSKKTISADLMLCRVACTCYRRSSVVCLCVCLSLCMSVGHNRKPCKNG